MQNDVHRFIVFLLFHIPLIDINQVDEIIVSFVSVAQYDSTAPQPAASKMNQHVTKTQTEHYTLHEGRLYCRTAELQCISFS